MAALFSVVYVSTAVSPMSEAQLESLLVEARRLNATNGVTGVLLYSDGNFMQCFEGSEASVAATYGRIRSSRKHKGLIELVHEPIEARSFRDWQMGFRHATESDLLALSSARWQRRVDQTSASAADDASGMYLLRHFWHQAQR